LWYDVPSDKVPFIKEAMPKEKYDLLISSLLMRVKEFYKDKKKELGYTFEVLSQKSGVPIQTLHNIFRCQTTTPRIDTVQAIERALGLAPTFTDEERALGLSDNHAVVLSDKDRQRLNALARAEEILGVEFVDAQIKLLEIAADTKAKK
jgi:transcriptional regulator with XRE-family HTH domain